ncbi:MAG: DUF4349 domain-containing protein [Fimbriimonadaceae bacterium]|nr:DUF4349 domain-containing protein [Fimbriimonadaceae bacterium]
MNRVLEWIFLVAVAVVLIGCSAGEARDSAKNTSTSMESASYDDAEAPQAAKLASQPIANNELRSAVQPKRAVIRNGSLSVRVPDVEKAEKEVESYVMRLGGFVSSSESTDLSSTAPLMTMKLRVPVDSFDKAMEFFEGQGARLEKKISGEDVTSKLVDFDARLKIMLAQEDSFRNMLSESNNSQEALDLQSRLMNLRAEIESLTAQRRTLGELASLSTIDLTLVSETRTIAQTTDQGWVQESWNQATTALGAALRVVGTFLLFALVFAPFWAPVAYLVWKRSAKAKTKPTFDM